MKEYILMLKGLLSDMSPEEQAHAREAQSSVEEAISDVVDLDNFDQENLKHVASFIGAVLAFAKLFPLLGEEV